MECGEWLPVATNCEGSNTPDEGDVSICLYCRHLAVFTADGGLREPTTEECIELHNDPNIRSVLYGMVNEWQKYNLPEPKR